MNLRQQIAKYVTGNTTTDKLPELGVSGLEEGLDSPNLRILAGLSKNESPFQIEHYFGLAIEELDLELPDKRVAAIEYALALVDEILDGKRDVIQGTREIMYNAIASYDFFSETKKYCYDSIGLDKVYVLLDTLDEISGGDWSWLPEKTNIQVMTETKAELFIELEKWKNKMNNGA